MRRHQNGEFKQAAAIYRDILKADSTNSDALHLLGLIALQKGDAKKAIGLIRRATDIRGDAPSYHMNLGEAYRLAGRLDDAAACYEATLALKPDHAGARNNLANILLEDGRFEDALGHYRQLATQLPERADVHYNLANALHRSTRPREAGTAYREALAHDPNHVGAAINLGQILAERGALDEAVALFHQALDVDPLSPEAHYSLANALRDAGRLEDAVASYRTAVHHRPDFVEAMFNLGAALQGQGALDEASACYQHVLETAPQHARAHNNLGTVLAEQTRHEEAIAAYGRAIALAPEYAEAHVNLGNAFLEQGRGEDATEQYRLALDIEPSDGLRIKLATILPIIPRSEQDIVKAREHYADAISALGGAPLELSDPLHEVGKTSFYLAYHGYNDRHLQVQLAELYARACPSLLFTAPHCTDDEPVGSRGRIHVGFLSRFFREHTIGRLLREIIARLDRQKFHVTVFFFPQPEDATSAYIAEHADSAVILPPDLATARARIADQALDVLFYADIGMEPFSYFLAFARLAPIQCAYWGHPVTTGIPNVDYFVSCAAMEPTGANDNYTECLVRLPTYNTCYLRPAPPDPIMTRSALGLPEDGTLYACPQSLFKFHPGFDGMLRHILEGDPNGRLALVGGTNPYWTGLLTDRLHNALGAAAERISFVQRLTYNEFLGLLALTDVMLDTTVFGGANTTLEGLAMGAPIVTLPSNFAPGRMTYACYRKMSYTELIATDEADYVRIALELGTDSARRAAARERILEANHVLYEDEAPVRELEGFFIDAVDRRRRGAPKPPAADSTG